MKPIIVALDRDGNLIVDRDNFPGTDPNWREQITLLPGVIEGVKKLRLYRNAKIGLYIVTNQSGVALTDICPKTGINFDNLTEDVADDVNRHTIGLFAEEGAMIDGFVTCPFVDKKYVDKSTADGRKVNPEFFRDGYRYIKPGIGMLELAAEGLGHDLRECQVYTIGDRDSDVQLAINAYEKLGVESMGILVPGWKTMKRGDIPKVEKLVRQYPGRVYIANKTQNPPFVEAAEFVVRHMLRTS